jgi:hypothetical protein
MWCQRRRFFGKSPSAGAAVFWDWLLIEHIGFTVTDDGDETGLRRQAKSLNYFGITSIGRIEL